MSLPSVALSSISGKAVAVYHAGCQLTPLKFKVVLDKGYTSKIDDFCHLGVEGETEGMFVLL